MNRYQEELNKLKEKQLNSFINIIFIVFSILMILSFYGARLRGFYLDFSLHLFNYLFLLIAVNPVIKIPYFNKKFLPLPAFFISGFIVILQVGNNGIGFLLFLMGILFSIYFISGRIGSVIVACSIVLLILNSVLNIIGIPVSLTTGGEFPFWMPFVTKPLMVFLITMQMYYFFKNYNLKLQESLEQEVEINRNNKLTEAFINSAPGIFYLYNENWELVRWNKNQELLTGYTAEELLNKKILDWFEGESVAFAQKTVSKALVNGEFSVECQLKIKDGTTIPMFLTAKRIDIDGKYYFCGIGIDISEKIKLQEEIAQAQKMEALGSIAGGIAHDLNNVLGAVLGFSEFIEEDIKNERIPKLTYIGNIIDATERASGIVKQILSFSRKSETKKSSVSFRTVVRDALKLIDRTMPKSIELRQNLKKHEYTIFADVNKLHQVVMNLCTNSWHAMRDTGGILTVNLDTIELSKNDLEGNSDLEPGLYECVEVTDTGKGISRENLEKIFDPFFTTKPEGEGTGLGLAVVFKIIKEHGGFVTVDSELNNGTTFKVCFPVEEQLKAIEKLDSNKEAEGGEECILLVDDELALRQATSITLERLGYTVIQAEDGDDGFQKFKENKDKLNLIITDLAMPKMTGFQLVSEIRKEKENFPAILCSGYSESYDQKDIPEHFFNGYLSKPIRKTVIADAIRRVFNGEIAGDE